MTRPNPLAQLRRLSFDLERIRQSLARATVFTGREAAALVKLPQEDLEEVVKPVLLKQWVRKRANGEEITCQKVGYQLADLEAFVAGRKLR